MLPCPERRGAACYLGRSTIRNSMEAVRNLCGTSNETDRSTPITVEIEIACQTDLKLS